MLAPALNEVPDLAPDAVISLLRAWRTRPYGMVIFQTGVGTRALFLATDALGSYGRVVRTAVEDAGGGARPEADG